MKKLFSIIMSTLMIACFMPGLAFADETKAAKIGTTEYETLDAAIQAVTDNTNPTTIELLSDVTLTGSGCCVEGKNITIEGNDKKIKLDHTAFNHYATTCGESTNSSEGLLTGSLTVKDVNFEATTTGQGYVACLGFNSQFAITLDGCTFTNMYTGVYANPRSNALAESEKLESITIKNCTYSNTTWGYSIDDSTAGALAYSKQATVKFENNTGLDTDHEMELFSGQVAEVDGTRYKDFSSALSAANGKTITLLANVKLEKLIQITNGQKLTVDLNGKKITHSEEGVTTGNTFVTLYVNGGNLTLEDSQETGAVEASMTVQTPTSGQQRCAVYVTNGGSFTLNGGAIKATSDKSQAVGVNVSIGTKDKGSSTFTMNGGKIETNTNSEYTATGVAVMGNEKNTNIAEFAMNGGVINSDGFGIGGNSDNPGTKISIKAGKITGTTKAIYHPQAGQLTISGGELTGLGGIEMKAGTAQISGTTKITATASPSGSQSSVEGNSTWGYAVAAVNGDKDEYDGNVNIKISNGVFTGLIGKVTDNNADEKKESTITITGGTFSTNPAAYLASSKYYTSKNNDGTYTVHYASSSGGGSSSTTTDTVTNKTEDKTTNATATTTATVKNTTTTASDGTKTVAATVDTTTATKIVEKAVENKSEEVVVNAATKTTVSETAAGTKTEVAIPAAAVSQVAEKTDAAVTIKSDAAEVTLDKEAVAAVAEAAGTTGEVKLVVDTVAQEEGKVEVDLKLVTASGKVSEFKGGKVSVTIKLNAKLATKEVKCLYIDDNKAYHKVDGQKNADGTFTFKTGHFSSYAVVEAEEADKLIAEQETKATELTKDLTLKARSEKTAKGNIKVALTMDADEIKAIEDLGYTVKYKFYRSTKKASSYKAKLEGTGKTYTNTTGKKGTKYYYKARVMVYDAEGTLIAKSELKQCKYACRTR